MFKANLVGATAGAGVTAALPWRRRPAIIIIIIIIITTTTTTHLHPAVSWAKVGVMGEVGTLR